MTNTVTSTTEGAVSVAVTSSWVRGRSGSAVTLIVVEVSTGIVSKGSNAEEQDDCAVYPRCHVLRSVN